MLFFLLTLALAAVLCLAVTRPGMLLLQDLCPTIWDHLEWAGLFGFAEAVWDYDEPDPDVIKELEPNWLKGLLIANFCSSLALSSGLALLLKIYGWLFVGGWDYGQISLLGGAGLAVLGGVLPTAILLVVLAVGAITLKLRISRGIETEESGSALARTGQMERGYRLVPSSLTDRLGDRICDICDTCEQYAEDPMPLFGWADRLYARVKRQLFKRA